MLLVKNVVGSLCFLKDIFNKGEIDMWEDELEKLIWRQPMHLTKRARLFEKLKPIIKSLLKEQRKICADEYMKKLPTDEIRVYNDNRMIKILNAPEPTGRNKE